MNYINTITPTNVNFNIQNELSVSKVSVLDSEQNPFSQYNDLENIYVDSHMISDLNRTTEHIDKIEVQLKQNIDKSPFENIDFEKEVENFSKDSVKVQDGSLAFTQANAKPSKVEELLK